MSPSDLIRVAERIARKLGPEAEITHLIATGRNSFNPGCPPPKVDVYYNAGEDVRDVNRNARPVTDRTKEDSCSRSD